MIPDGAQLLAFYVVLVAVVLVPHLLLWREVTRGINGAREEWRKRADAEDERQRRLHATIANMKPPSRAERHPIGFVLHDRDEKPRGDGRALIIYYEPAPSDDAAATLRERAR